MLTLRGHQAGVRQYSSPGHHSGDREAQLGQRTQLEVAWGEACKEAGAIELTTSGGPAYQTLS